MIREQGGKPRPNPANPVPSVGRLTSVGKGGGLAIGAGLYVRYALGATGFCALQRMESCAINRHNRQLFDDLVGAQHYRWGYGKAERLGGLEVQDHLKFCWQLHREITRLRAAQNAIDISGRATIEAYRVDSVGEQAAVSGKSDAQ